MCEAFYRHKIHFPNPNWVLEQELPVYRIKLQPGQILLGWGAHWGYSHGFNFGIALNLMPTEYEKAWIKAVNAIHCGDDCRFPERIKSLGLEGPKRRCETCKKQFRSNQFIYHKPCGKYNVGKKATCQICSKKVKSLHVHMDTVHKNDFQCRLCDQKVKQSHYVHFKECNKCRKCNTTMKSKTESNSHFCY